MTRIAPTLTLLAVAALGGGMFVANAINDPTSTVPAAPAAVAAPVGGADPAVAGGTQISLADLPVVGAPAAAAAPTGGTEIALGDLPVAGAAPAASGAAPAVPATGAPGRTEISLADITVAGAATPAAADDGASDAFAGRTTDDKYSVAVAVQGDRATAYVCRTGSVEAWLSGTATGGTLSLRSASGRTTLTGTVGAAGVDGSVTIDGVKSAYTAAATDVATAAGNGRPDVGRVVARLGDAG
ncbi:MAG TPA: hypothetical protein VNO83_20585 [Pseudonocardia sp.]|nr:hypothetical protein [Pseudonocardia sp.]